MKTLQQLREEATQSLIPPPSPELDSDERLVKLQRWYELAGVEELNVLITSALEHASHAWKACEEDYRLEKREEWPPTTNRKVGTLPYHLAALIEKLTKMNNLKV